MSSIWQLQEAKSRLSEVVDDALLHGPQIITRRGVETAVLLSYAEYRRLLLERKPLSEFFRSSPLAEAALELSRDESLDRDTPAL